MQVAYPNWYPSKVIPQWIVQRPVFEPYPRGTSWGVTHGIRQVTVPLEVFWLPPARKVAEAVGWLCLWLSKNMTAFCPKTCPVLESQMLIQVQNWHWISLDLLNLQDFLWFTLVFNFDMWPIKSKKAPLMSLLPATAAPSAAAAAATGAPRAAAAGSGAAGGSCAAAASSAWIHRSKKFQHVPTKIFSNSTVINGN